MGFRVHKGLMDQCVVCNPDKKKDREKRERRKRTGTITLDVAVKRQLSAEIGEEEISSGHKFALLQKYGVTAPRIDRLVTKPVWMDERLWRQKQNDWMRATKGLAVARQERRYGETQGYQRKGVRSVNRPSHASANRQGGGVGMPVRVRENPPRSRQQSQTRQN